MRTSTISDPNDVEIALGTVNEAGLKSILEDSHFSREFDQGVDLHNMKDDFDMGAK